VGFSYTISNPRPKAPQAPMLTSLHYDGHSSRAKIRRFKCDISSKVIISSQAFHSGPVVQRYDVRTYTRPPRARPWRRRGRSGVQFPPGPPD